MNIADMASLLIEGITPQIPKLWLTDDQLATHFNNGRAQKVSNRAFRIIEQVALPGDSQALPLDGGTLPQGSSPTWLQGAVTPTVISLSTNWTELVAIMSDEANNNSKIAVENAVATAVDGLVEMHKQWVDALLQTDGIGTLGTVSSVSAATKTVTLNATPFGARLVQVAQNADVVNSATNVKRGTYTIANRFQFIGSSQQFTYSSADVAGVGANDLIRYGGLTDGAPIGLNGLKYMVSTSTAGNLHGIPRTNPFTVASGFDNGAAQITLPALALAKIQRQNRLNKKALMGSFWFTHDSQEESYKELGYDRQQYQVNGKAGPLDLFFQGAITVDGVPIVTSPNADQTSWYLLQPDGFGRVKFKDPYWAMVNGSKVYNFYNGQTGTPMLQYGSTYINPCQFYCDNAVSQAVISNCGAPAGHISGS